MKFSRFEVVRVGTHVTLRASRDYDQPGGGDMQLNLDLTSEGEAIVFEEMFKRLILAATAFEDVPDHVLQATSNLTKGLQNER